MVRCLASTYTKKGDLGDCNNWREIALLDVVGKVVASTFSKSSYKSWL